MNVAQSFAEGNLKSLFPDAKFTHQDVETGHLFYEVSDADGISRVFRIDLNGQCRFFTD